MRETIQELHATWDHHKAKIHKTAMQLSTDVQWHVNSLVHVIERKLQDREMIDDRLEKWWRQVAATMYTDTMKKASKNG